MSISRYDSPGSTIGSQGTGSVIRPLAAVALFCAIAVSSWGNYIDLVFGLTYVTAPIIFATFFLLMALVVNPNLWLDLFKDGNFFSVLFYLIVVASFSWSLDRTNWPNQIFWYTVCVAAYFCSRYVLVNRGYMWLFISIMFGVFSAAGSLGDLSQGFGDFQERKSIGDLNANFTAYVLAGSLYVVTVIARVFFSGFIGRLIFFVAAFVVLISVSWLGTRGAFLSCVLLVLWNYFSRFFSGRGVLLLACGVIFSILVILLGGFSLNDITGGIVPRSDDDFSGRVPTLAIAVDFVRDYWATGIGAGAFVAVNPLGIGAHNVLITLLLESGFFGLLLFLLFLYSIIYPGVRSKRGGEGSFVLGAFFSYLVPIAMTGHWELAPFSWVLLGFTYNVLRLVEVQR